MYQCQAGGDQRPSFSLSLAQNGYKYGLNDKELAWLTRMLYAAGSEMVSGLLCYLTLSTHSMLSKTAAVLSWFLLTMVTWGVGHCFTWHVRVNLGFYFNFKIEELVDSRLTSGT